MPRRPRPVHRAPPRRKVSQKNGRLIKSSVLPTELVVADDDGDGNNETDRNYYDEGTGQEEVFDEDEDSTGDEDNADAPRVSQWVDEDEFEPVDEEGSEEEEVDAGPSQLKMLQRHLSSLPFGALRKARYALGQAEVVTDSEKSSDSEDSPPGNKAEIAAARSSKKEPVERGKKPRTDIPKRTNKHAPTEVTSKRPVSRLRQVVEVKKMDPRDPRFLSVTGEFKADKFHQNYGFLAEAHRNELGTLQENLKRARKMLENAPRHLRENYEEETRRLELAVKRTESMVNKDRVDKIQREAMQKASREEKEKRKQGKGSWYLKKSERRELVTRARFDALAAEGGKRAVAKAIVRRQRKISQKEKKSRPFPKGVPGTEEVRKRRAEEDTDERKRRRIYI